MARNETSREKFMEKIDAARAARADEISTSEAIKVLGPKADPTVVNLLKSGQARAQADKEFTVKQVLYLITKGAEDADFEALMKVAEAFAPSFPTAAEIKLAKDAVKE